MKRDEKTMARRGKRRPFAAPEGAPERLADALNQAIVDSNAEERAFQAYRYWVLGFTFREIAQKCGYGSHTTAMRAVKRARTQIVIRDNRELVARQGDRIEHAVRVVVQAIESWPAQDKLWAVDRLVPLLKRESELFNLDTQPGAGNVPVVVEVDASLAQAIRGGGTSTPTLPERDPELEEVIA